MAAIVSHLMFRMFEMASNQGVGIPGVAVSSCPGGRRRASIASSSQRPGTLWSWGIAIQSGCACWNNTMK